MKSGASFSACQHYRYALWRVWDPDNPAILFISLNPSTADESKDDATIRRCLGFARLWGYGGMWMVNLFAYRATHPSVLKETQDPIGPENDAWLTKMAAAFSFAMACWGNQGTYQQRNLLIRFIFPKLYCLAVTRKGQPIHPLYMPSSSLPKLYTF